MLRNFHLPNPEHEGTPREGTFDECKDETHVTKSPEIHQQIDVVGKAGLVQFDCEHKSHSYLIHPLMSTESMLNDLENLIPCAHDDAECSKNGSECVHKEKKGCGNRMKVTLRSGTLPAIIKLAFGDGTTN